MSTKEKYPLAGYFSLVWNLRALEPRRKEREKDEPCLSARRTRGTRGTRGRLGTPESRCVHQKRGTLLRVPLFWWNYRALEPRRKKRGKDEPCLSARRTARGFLDTSVLGCPHRFLRGRRRRERRFAPAERGEGWEHPGPDVSAGREPRHAIRVSRLFRYLYLGHLHRFRRGRRVNLEGFSIFFTGIKPGWPVLRGSPRVGIGFQQAANVLHM